MHRVLLILLMFIGGCAQQFEADYDYDDEFDYKAAYEQDGGKVLPPTGAMNSLADQMAADLLLNTNVVPGVNLLAVTTPVNLNDFQQSGDFNRQYGEALMTSLHQLGIRVMDLNGSDVLRVTPDGNFLLSRDFEMLSDSADVSHVLVATVAYNREGVQVYARVLQLGGNTVVSASRAELPWQQLSGHLQPSRLVNSKQGMLYRDEQRGESEVMEWNQ